MTVVIIGLGVLGGSLAIALNEVGFCQHIIGVDANPTHCKKALELNLVIIQKLKYYIYFIMY